MPTEKKLRKLFFLRTFPLYLILQHDPNRSAVGSGSGKMGLPELMQDSNPHLF